MNKYKPENYNSLSPYMVVDNASDLVDQLTKIFDAKTLRRFDLPNGKIMHVELLLDDTVLMISDSNEEYPAQKAMLHFYVADVHGTFERALENGCVEIEKPVSRENDPDTRGSFYDLAGNFWAVSTHAD